MFAQLGGITLRGLIAAVASHANHAYHFGLGPIRRSTLAEANAKARWQVEPFFRWVKQNLQIKRFLGTSEHAVKLQILTAPIAYLLPRLAHKALPRPASSHHLACLAKVNLMHRKTLTDLVHPLHRPADQRHPALHAVRGRHPPRQPPPQQLQDVSQRAP